MKSAILFLLLAALACSPAFAAGKTFLYGDYYAGMSWRDFQKTGPAECDQFPERIVCNRRNILFANILWTQFFEFTGDGLTAVGFGLPFSPQLFARMMAWLERHGYEPLQMQANDKTLDLSGTGTPAEERAAQEFKAYVPGARVFIASMIKEDYLMKLRASKDGRLPANCVVASLGSDRTQNAMYLIFGTGSEFKFMRGPRGE